MFAEASPVTGAVDVISEVPTSLHDVESDASTNGEVSDDEEDAEMLNRHADAANVAMKLAEVSSPSSTQAPSTPLPKEQSAGSIEDEAERSEQNVSPISAPKTPNAEWGQGSSSSDNEYSQSGEDLRPTLQKGRGPHRYTSRRKPAGIRSLSSGVSSCSSSCRRKPSSQRGGRGRSRTPVRKRGGNHRRVQEKRPKDNCQTFKPGDWFCAHCGDLQFARRSSCRVCGSIRDRPAKEEKGREEERAKHMLCDRERPETDEKWQREEQEWRREKNAKPSEALATLGEADRSRQCDVYVGNLPPGCHAEDVVQAFEALFNALPDFHERYPASSRTSVLCRCKKRPLNGQYLFLKFSDAVLASTAVVMTGLKVGTRSVRVGRPSDVEGAVVFPSPLDVQPLREELFLPNSYAAGSIMFEEIWIGTDRRGTCCDADEVERSITKALFNLEQVRQRFPRLTKVVTEVRPSQAGRYAYVTMANEVLASTLVSLGEVDLGKARARVNWTPSIEHDKQRKPAPSLDISSIPRFMNFTRIVDRPKTPDASLSVVTRSRSPARPQKLRAEEDQACSLYVGNMSGLAAGLLWDAFKKLFDAIPSYKNAYPDGEEPVLKIRTGGPSMDSFSFVLLRSPALASTAVKIGRMEVGGRSLPLARPANFRQPAEGCCPALELEGEKIGEVSEESKQDSEDPSSSESDAPAPSQLALLPPPPAPVRPPVTLWIGNLPYCGADARMLEAFLTHECLEAFCTHPSFQAPGLDLTNGPPIKKVTIHPSNRYAFVHVRDAKLGKLLIPIFDGAEYFGRPLRAAVAWFGSPSSYSNDNDVEQKSYNQQIGEEEQEFCDLGEAVAKLNMEDL